MIDIDLWNRRRKELKLSLYDIAEATQIGISTIKDIFRGKRPTPRIDTVEAIENVLGITRGLQQLPNDTPKKAKKERQPSEEVAALKAHVRKMGITYPELAERSGVPLQTIQKIFCGLTQHPRIDTMQALQQACGYEPPQPPPRTGKISTSSPASGVSLSEKETRLLQAFSALIPRLQDRVIDIAEIFADMLARFEQ